METLALASTLRTRLAFLSPKPLVGYATFALALFIAFLVYACALGTTMAIAPIAPAMLIGSTLLLAAVVAGFKFLIQVDHRVVVAMYAVPLYFLTILLPPPLAMIVGGIGIALGELSIQMQNRTSASDIMAATGRYMLAVLLASLIAHISSGVVPTVISYPLAAAAMFALDLLSFPLVLGPIVKQRPMPLIVRAARSNFRADGVQYAVGAITAVLASQSLWTLPGSIAVAVLAYRTLKTSTEMQSNTRHILEAMADAIDLRDPYTGGHSRRVTEYCEKILKEMQISGPNVDLVITAARVHDIGKIAIPDAILNKPGAFTPEERAVMETHSARGADLLRRHHDFARGVSIVRHHHEAWDGTGYPDRLAGTAIPLGARIIAVADSYDAITSDRPYRRGASREKATGILLQGRGIQWDPDVVDAFLRALEEESPQVTHLHLVPEVTQAAS